LLRDIALALITMISCASNSQCLAKNRAANFVKSLAREIFSRAEISLGALARGEL
jgi:hypothetical protein